MGAGGFTPRDLFATRFLVELRSQCADEPGNECEELPHIRSDPRQQAVGDRGARATDGAAELIARRLRIRAQSFRRRLAFGRLDIGIVADDPRGVVHALFTDTTVRLNCRGSLFGKRVAVDAVTVGSLGGSLDFVADAQDQLRGRFIHLELDRFEVATTARAFVHHGAPNRQKREGLFDRKLGVALRLNLGDDGRAHTVEQQANSRRLGGGAAPALNQRLDVGLVVVREMGETDTELSDVWTALVRPHDSADHLDRLVAPRVVQLASQRRPDLG